jgi:transglutaminase-like putative cysteine protease
MIRLMRAGFVLLAVFLTYSPLSAKEFLNLEKIKEQATAATIQKYPDSDEVLLDDFIQVEYQADGTSDSWDDTAVKILTEKGKRDQRTVTLGFDVAYGTNYFDKVQIIKPDGSVEEIDPVANSKVMVDPGQMSANIYNPNSKQLSMSIPGLEVGDTLRYIIRRQRNKTVIPDAFSDYQTFESSTPYERMTYQVIAPKDLPLVKTALKSEIPGTVSFNEMKTEQSDQIVYTWEVTDVPRMFNEPDMPTPYTVVQRLLISTMDSWEDLSKWYWELCKPHLEATTPEMIAMANELVEGATNTTQKIDAIFNFVSQDIRYMGITTEDEAPGYEPHDVSMTFSNRYGVCRDKAALLASMLRIVDVEAFPVIIMAGPKKDEEVPQPFFNHAVTAALGDDGEYILMDSTDENTKDIFPSYLQNMSYIVARPEGETLLTSPIIPAEDNLLNITSSGTLDKMGNLEAESTLTFEGVNDTIYRGYLSKIKDEERRQFFEAHIKRSMPTAELQTLEILPKELRDTTQPLTVHISYTADNLLIEGTQNKMLVLPKLGSSLGYANFLIGQTGLEKRKYPLYTRMTAGIRETLELKLPENMGTLNIPDYQAIDTDELTWNMDVVKNNNSLMATNTFLMNAVEFTPEQYLVLKQNLKDIEYNLRKKLILDLPMPGSDVKPDVRILSRETNIELESSSVWKETQRSKVEILTYGGTKKNSEIKLGYNPAWQNIELTQARVIQPDGSVKELAENELNIMDASWVASAPRYPAEKLLVANLPGVEVGSVLEYEFVSTVAGKPFFSTMQSFNGFEPVDSKTVTLSAPESLELNIRNTGIDETHSTNDGTISYIWKAENQPAVEVEEALPAWYTFNPTVFISSSDWKTYGTSVEQALMAATQGQTNVQELASTLIQGKNDPAQKAIAIRDWVAENIRQAGPGLTSLPLSALSPADLTLNDRYGNNPDRMILIYTLLQAAGFKPEFVLSGGIPLIPEEAEPMLAIPSRQAFSAVLVKINIGKEPVYMDGSSQYAELGTTAYDRRPVLELNSGSIGEIKVDSDKEDRSHIIYTMNVSADGNANLTQSSTVQGTTYEGFHQRYAEITPENRRRHYLEIVSGVSQSAKADSELLTAYDTYPGKLEFSVNAERYAVQDGDYLYFTIPGGLGSLLKYRSNERELPLAWGGYVDSISEYHITLPEGYEPLILPECFSWQAPNGAGMVEIAIEYEEKAHTLRITQMADLNPAIIPAEDFPDIIAASKKLAHPDMRTILLKKKQAE